MVISKYLILILVIAVGIPAAYAVTITLGGDPIIINGILDMMNNKITNLDAPTLPSRSAPARPPVGRRGSRWRHTR